MKQLLMICSALCLFFVTGCLDKSAETYGFEESFTSAQELKHWAKNSTADEGRFHELEFKDKKIMLVYRSHDEMARHSDLGVYQEKDGAWHLLKAHPPTEEGIFEAKVYVEKIEFNFFGQPDKVLLTITADDLL